MPLHAPMPMGLRGGEDIAAEPAGAGGSSGGGFSGAGVGGWRWRRMVVDFWGSAVSENVLARALAGTDI